MIRHAARVAARDERVGVYSECVMYCTNLAASFLGLTPLHTEFYDTAQ